MITFGKSIHAAGAHTPAADTQIRSAGQRDVDAGRDLHAHVADVMLTGPPQRDFLRGTVLFADDADWRRSGVPVEPARKGDVDAHRFAQYSQSALRSVGGQEADPVVVTYSQPIQW